MNGMIVGQTYRPLSDFVWLCQLDEMNGMMVCKFVLQSFRSSHPAGRAIQNLIMVCKFVLQSFRSSHPAGRAIQNLIMAVNSDANKIFKKLNSENFEKLNKMIRTCHAMVKTTDHYQIL
jgi:hypothetical protein